MKTTILQIVLSLVFAIATYAEDAHVFLTDTDVAQAKSELQAFEKDQVTLEEISAPDDKEWGHKLVLFFETHTNEVTTKMKLPISRCYGAMGNDSAAARLAEDYVTVFSNDWHGWRVIGSANLDMGDIGVSVDAYTKAVQLGDDGSCAPLAFTSMKIGRLDIVKNILPRLYSLKKSKPTRYVRTLDVVTALVLYSLRANQEDIFVKALDGVSMRDILSRDDLQFLVRQGCKQFNGKDIDKISQELGAAGGVNSNSSKTNGPLP
jgi:hypothetical protein